MSRCARCDMLSRVGIRSGAGERGGGGVRRVSISVGPRRSGYQRPDAGREYARPMSTRTLLILAALTGVAILTAGAVQILLAR